MVSLFESYNFLIKEGVSISELIKAIDEHQVIRFYYEGDNTEKKGWRIGEIYALGVTSKGNKVARIYQLKGETDTVIPDWKLFRIEFIRDIEFLRSFSKPRSNFNSQGDKSMSQVNKIIQF